MDTVKLVFVLFQVIARGTPDPLSLKHELPLQNLKNNHYLPYKLSDAPREATVMIRDWEWRHGAIIIEVIGRVISKEKSWVTTVILSAKLE